MYYYYIIFMFYFIIICDSSAINYSITPIPHSDCPTIDDVNHAVMLPYPQDCTKYYSCLKGNAYVQQCPSNLHWSTVTYRCDYPDVAKCQTILPPIPANTINAPGASVLEASLTSEILYQLHERDCTKYYKCEVFICPTNYYWNFFMKKCDFPHNAQCPFAKSVDKTKAIVSSLPLQSLPSGIEAGQKDIFVLHYPNDCAKFYQCQTMLCPANYFWNNHEQQCDLPQLAQCPLQPQVVETSTSAVPTAFTAPPTPIVTTESSDNTTTECLDCIQKCDGHQHQYLPHPYDCHKFIQCNGWSFIHTCPDNLFWNAKLNTCDRMCVAN